MLNDVLLGNFAKVVLQMLVEVLTPALNVGVFLFGAIDESHLVDMGVDLLAGEVALEMRVLERVVVRQGHLAHMVVVYEWLLAHRLLR